MLSTQVHIKSLVHVFYFCLPFAGFVVSVVGDGVDGDAGEGCDINVAFCDVVVGGTSDISKSEYVQRLEII
jgi:hypothetical protein